MNPDAISLLDAFNGKGANSPWVDEILKQHRNTPSLIVDLDHVRSKARSFVSSMPRIQPHYAMKANPHPEILKVLIEEGVRFEIASIAELDMLLALNVPAREIFYSNPIKPLQYIEYAAQKGVEWYVLDSIDELDKIVSVYPAAKLYLRVETQNLGADWPLTGKFGATLPEIHQIIEEAKKLNANLSGVTFHVGSQCRNLENWHIGVENAKIVFNMMTDIGFEPVLLDIGGGFPVQYTKPIPTIEDISESINSAIADLPESIQVIAEPGRFMVGDSSHMVSRVIGTATRHGTRWIYLDTGVFHGLMETVEGMRFELFTETGGAKIPCTVAGPSCDSMDVIMRDEMLPINLQEGDYVCFQNMGAYSTAYASDFNGFPKPEVIAFSR
ncbi:MAG TPA: type III PLP-dependent enzyme [Gammaproteobacteria bacterium]|nr:type III PLP-dependent enzyme [Gammaproteobacteria bacterium]